MDFMKLLKSFEDFLYEVVSWFVFYPMTLWRSLRHPQEAVRRAAAAADADVAAEDDMLSPPLFLLVTLLIAHGLEIGTGIAGTLVLPPVLQNDSNLLLARAIVFCTFPLVMAVLSLRGRGAAINRATLRAPFYGQCCLIAPAALAVGVGTLLVEIHGRASELAGLAVIAVATLWYLLVEGRWFAGQLKCSPGRAIGVAILGYLLSLAVFVIANLLIYLMAGLSR